MQDHEIWMHCLHIQDIAAFYAERIKLILIFKINNYKCSGCRIEQRYANRTIVPGRILCVFYAFFCANPRLKGEEEPQKDAGRCRKMRNVKIEYDDFIGMPLYFLLEKIEGILFF
jgi:hypothetical protein